MQISSGETSMPLHWSQLLFDVFTESFKKQAFLIRFNLSYRKEIQNNDSTLSEKASTETIYK